MVLYAMCILYIKSMEFPNQLASMGGHHLVASMVVPGRVCGTAATDIGFLTLELLCTGFLKHECIPKDPCMAILNYFRGQCR